MTAEQFFQEHGVTRIEELSHVELLEFAQECMDQFSSYSARILLSGAYGVSPDPMPKETDAAIIEAYNKGLSFVASYIDRESAFGPLENNERYSPYDISVQDRREFLTSPKSNGV